MPQFVRTYKRRKAFLDSISVGDSVSMAATGAGGTTRQFKAWAKEDANFEADWKEAEEQGTDFIEDIAVERAIKKSDVLMMAVLKARRPDKYDRGSKLELSGGISVEGAREKLLNRLAKLKAGGQLIAQGPPALPAPEDP